MGGAGAISEPIHAMLYFEDLQPGDRFNTSEHCVTAAEIIEFAQRHDPQPFHTDPEAAKQTFFGGLVASGWQTAAISMGLMVRGEMPLHGGVIGQAVDNLRWPRPVRPGDRLRVVMEVAGLEPHPARAGFGWLRLRCRTLNQDGKAVQEMTATLLVARRPADFQ